MLGRLAIMVICGVVRRYGQVFIIDGKKRGTELSGTLSGIVSALVQADPHVLKATLRGYPGSPVSILKLSALPAGPSQSGAPDRPGGVFLAHVNETLQALDDLLAIYQLKYDTLTFLSRLDVNI